ncbi:THAP domain-containing protein 8 [Tachyglossus aculeatus]|uniref:THAP domain-containing protein 8 n=1 Tax=Tachyglossus aculeatus TaxID=9261 RepID=UPI0018F61C80|nr:THAP domain-containing protein 8 [Tachyglossus aculeatus]
MPKYCRAPNCSNTAGHLSADNRRISFYKFPLQDPARLQEWLQQMRQDQWVPTRHQHLCSDHFAPSCFEWRWGVRYLKPDAVPTIFRASAGGTKRKSPGRPPAEPGPKRPAEGEAGPTASGPLGALAIAIDPGLASAPVYVEAAGEPGPRAPLLGTVSLVPLLQLVGAEPPGEPGALVIENVAIEPFPEPLPLPPASPAPMVAYFETIPTAAPLTPAPAPPPETVLSSALSLPIVSTVPIVSNHGAGELGGEVEMEEEEEEDDGERGDSGGEPEPEGRLEAEHGYHKAELSAAQLAGVVAGLQRKVKGLQQRHRRHCAKLEAMEGLVEQLRKENLVSEEKLRLLEMACLQTGAVVPEGGGTVAIICQEDDRALVYTVPPQPEEPGPFIHMEEE